jgi:hypothetical protein
MKFLWRVGGCHLVSDGRQSKQESSEGLVVDNESKCPVSGKRKYASEGEAEPNAWRVPCPPSVVSADTGLLERILTHPLEQSRPPLRAI